MFYAQVFTQLILQLLMKRPAVSEYSAVPNLLQIRNELIQWRQCGFCDKNIHSFHVTDEASEWQGTSAARTWCVGLSWTTVGVSEVMWDMRGVTNW